MDSLLSCDLVGFQLYEYARHFFTSCQWLLGLQADVRIGGMLGIIYKGREVSIRVGHVGLSVEDVRGVIGTEEYRAEVAKLVQLTGKRLVIAGVDRLSPLSGIKNKLDAYYELLAQYPQYRGRLLLVQYCVTGKKLWPFVEETSRGIKGMVKRINERFKNSVVYEEGPVSAAKRFALLNVAEVLLITTLRDGFSLTPFEFILVKEAKKSSPGKIIMSEFAGCINAMMSIWWINPYNISAITEALLNSTEVSPHTTEYYEFQNDLKYVEIHDDENWLRSLILDMRQSHSQNEKAIYLGAINKKVLKADFRRLLPNDILRAYQKSVHRVILLDSEVYSRASSLDRER